MHAYRIADRRYPIFDGTGARLVGGRWNSPGSALIYAVETYAGALLEVLAHANLSRLPRTHASVVISIPDDVSVEKAEARDLPGWANADQLKSRAFGDRWLAEQRTAALLVPSLVTGGREHNVLINPAHHESARITASQPEDVAWDPRLFARRIFIRSPASF